MALAIKTSSKPRCTFCKRRLTDAESIALGAGPECRAKLQAQMAAVDAGRAIESTIGDYNLSTLGARLRTYERIEARYVGNRAAVPDGLQADLQTARAKYARRVEFLAAQGFLTIPELPTAAPSSDVSEGVALLAPSEYELACEAFKEAEAFYQRERDNPHSTRFVEACIALQEAREARSAASFALVMAGDKYPGKRSRTADGATTLMSADAALAQIGEEWIAHQHDYAADDAKLRRGEPVYTFEACYVRAV